MDFQLKARAAFLQDVMRAAGAKSLWFGNSGGKDSALVGILCAMACPQNTTGVILPCQSRQNYTTDTDDALALAAFAGIHSYTVDLTAAKACLTAALGGSDTAGISEKTLCCNIEASESLPAGQTAVMPFDANSPAGQNIAPRLRMTALYALAQRANGLVVGTGNASERYIGYFTKYGDGGCDVNPIADLTATQVTDCLRQLGVPPSIWHKPPSAGLFEGQTDERDLGFSYAQLDDYLQGTSADTAQAELFERLHTRTEHKRQLPVTFAAWSKP